MLCADHQIVVEKYPETALYPASIGSRSLLFGYAGLSYRVPYRTVAHRIWKEVSIRFFDNLLHLSNGRGNDPLILSLPLKYQDKKIVRAELVLRNDTFYLHLTIDTGEGHPPKRTGNESAGLDLGEIHIASVSIDTGDTLIVSGRHLRSIKQKRNKSYKQIGQKVRNKQSLSKERSKVSKRQLQYLLEGQVRSLRTRKACQCQVSTTRPHQAEM